MHLIASEYQWLHINSYNFYQSTLIAMISRISLWNNLQFWEGNVIVLYTCLIDFHLIRRNEWELLILSKYNHHPHLHHSIKRFNKKMENFLLTSSYSCYSSNCMGGWGEWFAVPLDWLPPSKWNGVFFLLILLLPRKSIKIEFWSVPSSCT